MFIHANFSLTCKNQEKKWNVIQTESDVEWLLCAIKCNFDGTLEIVMSRSNVIEKREATSINHNSI